jgi:hypothetical protein
MVYMTGVALCVLAAGFLLTDRLLYPPLLEQARRICPDMTCREVEAVLGRPPDTADAHLDGRLTPIGSLRAWAARTETALVYFHRLPGLHEEVVRWAVVVHRPTGQPLYISGEPDPHDLTWLLSMWRELEPPGK